MDAAFTEVDEAIRRLQAVVEEHPWFRLDVLAAGVSALRAVLEKRSTFVGHDRFGVLADIKSEDLVCAYQRVRGLFRRPRRTGRPRAEWRHQTIALLRQTGVTRRDAELLADLAGLTAEAPPATLQERRRKAAHQKQRARRERRAGSEKPPRR